MANFLTRLFTRDSSTTKEKQDYTMAVGQGTSQPSGMSMMSAARQFRYGAFPDMSVDDRPDPIFRPINKFAIFVEPPVSYSDMLTAYQLDTELKFGIDFATAVTVGSGFHFTSPHQRIIDYFEDFAEDINLDHIVQTAGLEALAFGDSVWRYANYEDKANKFDQLVCMPLTGLKRVWWNGWTQDSTIGFYEFRGYAVRRYVPNEIIHFRNKVLNGSPYGYGLLAPLVQKVDYKLNWNGVDTTYTRAAFFDIMRSLEDSAHKIMKRYVPRNVHKAPGASPQQVSAIQSTISQLLDEQDFVVPNEQYEVQELGNSTRPIDLETFENMYRNSMRKATGNPVSKLFETGSLTEASSTVAKETALMYFVGFTRTFKRQVERFILKSWYDQNPTTDANGVVIPWKLADVQLVWGTAEPLKMDAQGFARMVMAKPEAFSIKDIRQICADADLPIDPDEVPSITEQQQAAEARFSNMQYSQVAATERERRR